MTARSRNGRFQAEPCPKCGCPELNTWAREVGKTRTSKRLVVYTSCSACAHIIGSDAAGAAAAAAAPQEDD